MEVDRIELFHVAIPLPKPFHPAWIPGYPQTVNRFTLLRLTTDDGVQGLAAGVAFEKEREGLGGLLGPYLIGLDPTDIATVRQRIREASYLGWRNYWLEAAFWDIKGQIEGKPVWALLGGKDAGRAPVYASTGEVHPPQQRANEVLALREMGFHTVKLRVHSFDPAEDVAQIETVRRAVGDTMEIGVDANQGWRVALIDDAPLWTLERATKFAHACAGLDVSWIEEPLDMHAYDEQAELRRRSSVPIAGGELNGGWHQFKVMLEKGSYDIYQPDATMGGGISDAVRVMKTCQAQGLGYTPHTWTNGLGFLINLHVFAAGPRDHPIEYPLEPPSWIPEARDGLLVKPVQVASDGTIAVPDTPGLGIELDEDKVARYAEKYFEITSRGLAIKTIRDKGLFTALRLSRKKKR
ncbi:MAG: mandelate racemase/muconate lactonizing enzyme family protein [Anaerolineae bacterium]|jgi:L-alanine-DL-glutamate epimerase-like enolase superfamily enzyme